jgi:hypothetical protein
VIQQVDGYAARCEECGTKGALAGCMPEALNLARKDGWKIGRQKLIHEKTTTCPPCAAAAKEGAQ